MEDTSIFKYDFRFNIVAVFIIYEFMCTSYKRLSWQHCSNGLEKYFLSIFSINLCLLCQF